MKRTSFQFSLVSFLLALATVHPVQAAVVVTTETQTVTTDRTGGLNGSGNLGDTEPNPIGAASSTDLLNGLTPTASSGNFVPFNNGGISRLTDGSADAVHGDGGDFSNRAIYFGPYAIGDQSSAGSSLTYDLGGVYNLSSIVIYGGWIDGGRDQQNVDVLMSTDGVIFTSLGATLGGNLSSSDLIFHRNTIDSPDAGEFNGVQAIRFNFADTENNGTGYTEIDVFGVVATDLLLRWNLEEGSGSSTTEVLTGSTIPTITGVGSFINWSNGIAPGSSYGLDIAANGGANSVVNLQYLDPNGNYVTSVTNEPLVLTDEWTIGGWVKLPVSANSGQRALMGGIRLVSEEWQLFVTGNGNTLGMSNLSAPGLNLPEDQALFVAVTASASGTGFSPGNNHRFSVWDGSTWQHVEGAGYYALPLGDLTLGSGRQGVNNLGGEIDDWRVYKAALSEADLTTLARLNGGAEATITAATASPTNASTVVFNVAFSQEVTGFDVPDLIVASTLFFGTPIIGGSGTAYTVTFPAVSGNGTLSLDIQTGSGVTTLTGEPLLVSNPSPTVTVDQTAPTVSSVIPRETGPTNATSITFDVVFSEAVFGFLASDVVVNHSGTSHTDVVITGSGTSWEVTVNGLVGSGGSFSITVPADSSSSAQDGAGNSIANSLTSAAVTIDTPPTVSSVTPRQSSPTNAGTLIFDVVFSEAVTGFVASDVTVTPTGTVASTNMAIGGSGTTWDVTVSGISGDGTLVLTVPANANSSAQDSVGNSILGSLSSSAITIDNTLPTVTSVTPRQSGPTTATSIIFDVVLNEGITGFVASDVAVNHSGTAHTNLAIAGTGQNWTVTVEGISGTGTFDLTVPSGAATAVQDAATNALDPLTGQVTSSSVTIDNAAPVVSSITPRVAGPTNATSLIFDVVFSEAVTGFAFSDVTVNQSGASHTGVTVTGSGTTWAVTVTGVSGTGTLGITVPSGNTTAVQDALGNTMNPLAGQVTSAVVTVDNTAPTVSSVTPQQSGSTNATSVSFDVVFSEAVTGFAASDVAVNGSGVTHTNVAIAGSGQNWTVTLEGVSGNGTLGLTVPSGNATAVQDAATNALDPLTGQVTSATVTIDNTAPTVSSVAPQQSGPTNATSIVFDVTFSAAITGFAATDVAVNHSGTAHTTVSVAGSGQNWTATVQGVSGNGTLGITVPSGAATAVQDSAGNALDPLTGQVTSTTVTIDNTAPTVSSVAPRQTGPTTATSIIFDVIFNDVITGFAASDVLVNHSGTTHTDVVVTGSGTAWEVTVNGLVGSGDSFTITVPADSNSSAQDSAGNSIANSLTSSAVTIDNRPTVVSVAPRQSGPTRATSLIFDVVFSEAVIGFAASDVAVTTTGTVASTNVAIGGSGATWEVTVSGISGDGTLSLTVPSGNPTAVQDLSTNALDPLTGQVTSAAVTIDNTGPTVSSVTPRQSGPTTATSIIFDVVFNEAVTGFAASDVLVNHSGTSHTGVAVTGSGAAWEVTVNGLVGDGGSFTITVPANTSSSAQDSAGNSISGSRTSSAVTIDNRPAVVSVTPRQSSPTNATTIIFDVVFDEAVTGFAASDVTVAATGSVAYNSTVTVGGSGTSWEVTVNNVSGDGTLSLTVPSGNPTSVQDAQGNALDPLTGQVTGSVVISNSVPTVLSITPRQSGPTSASSIIFDVLFSETITGFVAGDVVVNHSGTAHTGVVVTGSGTAWQVTINGLSGDGGSFTLTVPASTSSSAQDNAGNSILGSRTSVAITVDNTAPTVSSVTPRETGPTTANSLIFDVVFSEAVTGFAASDVAVNHSGTASTGVAVSGSGAAWEVTVSGVSGDGTFTLTVPSGNATAVQDAVGNALNPSTGQVTSAAVAIDNSAPTVSSVTPRETGPITTGSVIFDVVFSEAITGFAASDVAVNHSGTTHTDVTVAGSGSAWEVTVSGLSGNNSTFTITVPSGNPTSVQNLGGIALDPGSGQVTSLPVTVETLPTVTSVTPQVSGPTSATSIIFDVDFSESIIGFIPGDVTVNHSGTAHTSVAVSGSGTTWEVTVSGISGDGSFTLTVPASTNSSAKDSAFHPIANTLTSAPVIIDNNLPTVTSITPRQTGPTSATSIIFDVVFSEPMTGFVAGDVAVNHSGTTHTDVVVTGSGTAWEVTVNGLVGNNGSFDITVPAGASSAAQDSAGNAITSAFTSSSVTINNVPTVVSVIPRETGPTSATSIIFDVVFSEVITGFAASDVLVNHSGTAHTDVAVSGSGIDWEVTVSGLSGDGAFTLTVPSGSATAVQDVDGNALDLLTGQVTSAAVTLENGVSPTVISVTPRQTGLTNATSIIFDVVFSEPVTGFVPGDVLVNHAGTTHTDVVVTGSGTAWEVAVNGLVGDHRQDHTFTITVPANTSSSAQDNAGNSIANSLTSAAVAIDNTGITVVSIVDSVPTNLTDDTIIGFTIDLSELPVQTFLVRQDLQLNLDGVTFTSEDLSRTGISRYEFRLFGVSGDGTVSITIPGSQPSITVDFAGNPIVNQLTSDVITVDQTPPTVTITPQGPDATNAANIRFNVTFSEPVTGFESTDVVYTLNGVSRVSTSFSGSGASYEVGLNNVSGNGTVTATIPHGGSGIVDAAGNALAASPVGATLTVDTVAPTVSAITLPGPATTNADNVRFDVTFNEPVTGFDISDVVITPTGSAAHTGAELSVTGATSYQVSLSGVSGDGTYVLTVPDTGSGVADLAGNALAGGTATSPTLTIDNTAPTVSAISPQGSSSTNADSIAFDVTFSEAVVGLDPADVTVTPTGTVASTGVTVSGSDAAWVVTVNGVSGDGTLAVTVPANTTSVGTDTAGNSLSGSLTSAAITVDNTAPPINAITLQGSSPTSADSISFDVTFGEAVIGLDPADVTVTPTGTVASTGVSVSGSGTAWVVTVNGVSGDGTLAVTVPANTTSVGTDAAGNSLSGSVTSAAVTVDNTGPTVSAVTPQGPSSTNAASISFDVTFDDAVVGLDPTDVTVVPTGTVASTGVAVSGSGTAWVVTVNGVTGDGTLAITVPANSSSVGKDAAGNSISGSVTSAAVTVDNTGPTVSAITPQNSGPTNADSISFNVTFSDAVTGFVAGDVTLVTTGTVAGTGASVTGTGTAWVVTVTGVSGDGTLAITVPANATSAGIDIAGNSISGSLTSAAVTIDNTGPTVTSITPADAPDVQGDYLFTVVFSEAITGFDAQTDLTLTLGNLTAVASDFQTSDNITHTFKLAGSIAESVNVGTAIASVNLSSDVTDVGGNPLTAPSPASSTVFYFRGGLVLHWDLEEGSGTFTTEQVSGVTDVAQFVEGPTWGSGLAPGSSHAVQVTRTDPASYVSTGSLRTDGQYVTGQPDSIILEDAWSIAGWIQVASLPSQFSEYFIGNIFPPAGGNIGTWYLGVSSTQGLNASIEGTTYNSNFTVPLNQPVFVSLTFEATGVFKPNGPFLSEEVVFRLSMWDGTTWQHSEFINFASNRSLRLQDMQLGSFLKSFEFDGVVDEFRIYHRTLAQTDLDFLASSNGSTTAAVTAVTASPTSGASVQFQVDFAHDVTGFDAADLAITSDSGLTLGSAVVAGSGKTYTVTVPVSGGGNISLDLIPNASVRTLHGGGLLSSTPSAAITVVDITPPYVVSMTAGTTPDSQGKYIFTTVFSEPVTGFDALADVSLALSGVSASGFEVSTSDNITFTFKVRLTVDNGLLSGTASAAMNLSSNVTDTASNALTTPNPSSATLNLAATAYQAWAVGQGLSAGSNFLVDQDADGDRRTNLVEYQRAGDPRAAGPLNEAFHFVNLSGQLHGVLTIAAPAGITYSSTAAGTISASVALGDGSVIIDQIDSSLDLVNFGGASGPAIIEDSTLTPPAGLPTLPSGWTYRHFRFVNPVTKGFMRSTITLTPPTP